MKSLPNILTILRIVAIPFFVLAFYLDRSIANYVTFFIFVIASITDYLDGYLARILGAFVAKIKTAIQFVAISAILLDGTNLGVAYLDIIGLVLIWIAAVLTIITGYAYCKEGYKHLINDGK